ncbi:MAG: hypothetical protein CMA72_09770 [Euryarchaeota archaeon]|nr:hypothetical protein [Euryarchaeota archaeon]|tara:strand:- start:7 stop:270 length:264 start_codon:yes stop_codon:yes gene_type:complete
MKITKRRLRRVIREAVLNEAGRGIMHIIKKHGGKRLPKADKYDFTRYEFKDDRTAELVVWTIADETGRDGRRPREVAASGNIVTVYT